MPEELDEKREATEHPTYAGSTFPPRNGGRNAWTGHQKGQKASASSVHAGESELGIPVLRLQEQGGSPVCNCDSEHPEH